MNVIYLQDGIISIADEIRVVYFQSNGYDIATIWMQRFCVYINGKGGKSSTFNVFQPKVYFVCLFVCSYILSHE